MALRTAVIIGGYLSTPEVYGRMAVALSEPPWRYRTFIVPIRLSDWLFASDQNFRPLLDLVATTVEYALKETGSTQVDLIGHSAGGRLARAYLGDQPYMGRVYAGSRLVRSLITLGAAHISQERWVARFSTFVNEYYPGNFYAHIAYRSVVGDSVPGRRWGSAVESWAFRSYELVSGKGTSTGDGIVPVESCYLPGADNLVLRGVRHGPYTDRQSWYGAPDVIPYWAEGLLSA